MNYILKNRVNRVVANDGKTLSKVLSLDANSLKHVGNFQFTATMFGKAVSIWTQPVGEDAAEIIIRAVTSDELAERDKYTVYWYRYPHGIEGEEMESKSRDFDDYDKAVAFLDNRHKVIGGIYWAGGRVENEDGFVRYELTDGGDAYTANPANKEGN